MNFNPIIVLFLTPNKLINLYYLDKDFNPIIVLFLTENNNIPTPTPITFQSYYSLISNFIS